MSGRTGIAALGAVIAVVLQLVVAPNVSIMGTIPSFIIAYSVAAAMVLPRDIAYIMVFCLGLIADLVGYGPVGALPFILLVCTFALSYAKEVFGNGTLFVSCLIVLAFTLLVHFLHAAFMVAVTSTYTAIEAFRLIAIPQSLYDCVLAIVLYVLVRRLLAVPEAPMASVGPLK